MTSYTKTNRPGLVIDNNSHAVINTDDDEYKKILEKRRQFKHSQAIQQEIDNLKTEFLEIKEMLKQALSGKA